MDKRKQQQIEDLLKKLQSQKAPKDFTATVMNDLKMLSNEELLKDVALTSLLKRTALEQLSAGFVSSVMARVEAKATFEYRPIISKRSWILISTAVIAIIAYMFYKAVPSDTPSLFTKVSPYLENTFSTFETTQMALQNFVKSFQVSSLFAMSFIALTVLILVDFLSKERSIAKST